MPRYEAAVAAIVLDNKSETKKYNVAVGEVLRCNPFACCCTCGYEIAGWCLTSKRWMLAAGCRADSVHRCLDVTPWQCL